MTAIAAVALKHRILLLQEPGLDDESLTPALRLHGVAATVQPLSADVTWAHADVDAVLVRAPEISPVARTAAQRLRRAMRYTPLLLWAALAPSGIEDAFNAGFDAWLPGEAPIAAVVGQVRALCRLAGGGGRATGDSVTLRGVTIDFQRREVLVQGRPLPLTPTEFRIISHLGRRPGQTVSHADLFRAIHGYDASESEAKDILKVHISRLRTKLAAGGVDGDLVTTMRGFGYLLERRVQSGRRERSPRP